MARTAKSTGFQFNAQTLKGWAQDHQEEIRVGAVAAAVTFFFSHGLPLWDDDYSQWLTQANQGFFSNLIRFLSPFTTEPQTWGYSDRPGQVLIYQILHLLFGYWGTGFFFVKSVVFGALIGALYRWMRKLQIERAICYGALALFAFSTNALASILWHSDFSVYSQLILVLILFWAYPQIEKGPSQFSIYKKGLGNLPAAFTRFALTFFFLVYFGSKVRGDVRLAPVILLAYLAIFRFEKFKVYLPPMGLTFLATLPWSGQMFKQLPPFLGGKGYQGWTYGSFSISRVFEFLGSDLFTFKSAPLSVLGGLGIVFVLLAIAYFGYQLYREKIEAPDEKWGFFLVWFLIALLACGTLASQNKAFELRYTVLAMVPAVFLIGLGAQNAYRELSGFRWIQYATVALVFAQVGLHFFHDYQYRRDMGHTIVAVDKIYSTMEKTYANAQLLFAPGFLPYGYKTTGAAPSVAGRKTLNSWEEVARYQAGNTYVASWNASLDPRMTVATVATGCGSSLFDAVFGCKPTEGAVLLKYVGPVSELAQADQLDKQGNLAGARQTLEGYLQRDPNNHGVAFIAALYAYKSGDHARMEQIYDNLGPYFPGHPSIVYNWGLAKQGVQKFAEASKLLERAYAMVPKDYAIGFNLADSYFKAGKKTRALATLDELLKTYPDNKPMKDAYSKWSQ